MTRNPYITRNLDRLDMWVVYEGELVFLNADVDGNNGCVCIFRVHLCYVWTVCETNKTTCVCVCVCICILKPMNLINNIY